MPRADILRSYDWLGVSDAALADVDRMYRRAYGGADAKGAIGGLKVVLEEHPVAIEDEELDIILDLDLKMEEAGFSAAALFPNSPIETLTPLCRAPPLRLQTNFDHPPPRPGTGRPAAAAENEEEEEELTARPERQRSLWAAASIDEVLAPKTESKSRRPGSGRSDRLGPNTPRGYDDISPVTRGEWGFLFSDAGFGVRTAAVEQC